MRGVYAALLVGLAFVSAGCTMCASPYDYCGPLDVEGPCGQGEFLHRHNSVFSSTMPEVTVVDESPEGEFVVEESPYE
jgi:hypothetical protein